MHIWKRTLLILIPLAVLAVAFIVLTAIQLITKKTQDIHYSEPLTQRTETSAQTQNVFSKEGTSAVGANAVELGESDTHVLYDWQDSGNIRHFTQEQVTTTSPQQPTSTSTDQKQVQTTKPPPTPKASSEENFDIWGWVPQTTVKKTSKIKPTAPNPTKTYANTIGKDIKTAVAGLGSQTRTMERFIENPDKKTDMLSIGNTYEQLGVRIIQATAESTAPEDIKKSGYELGSAYRTVGMATNFLTEQAMKDDLEMLQLIYIYNGHIDDFAKRFISFATLLGAHGVQFTTGEGGDIFTPPAL